jgi:hypothetical protein
MLLRGSLPALALALLLVPASALAQVSDADRATARTLAQQGQDALDAKDYATAADRFGRAGELVRAPTLTLGLARSQVGLGRWIAAQETYNRLLREGVPAGAPPAFARAVADAKRELDALEPRIPSVIVNVKGAASFDVLLDGQPLPRAVLGVNRLVDPGEHVLRATSQGLPPVEARIKVAEHKVETVTLTLGAAPPPPPVPVPLPVKPPAPVKPPPPPPPLVVRPPLAVLPPVAPAPAPRGSLQKTLGFVGIGVGGAGLVMGAVAGGIALGKHNDLAKVCPSGVCTDQQSALDSYHLAANISTAGFVVGGVLAATGVVLLVTSPRRGPARDAWIAPVLGAGYAGAVGRF